MTSVGSGPVGGRPFRNGRVFIERPLRPVRHVEEMRLGPCPKQSMTSFVSPAGQYHFLQFCIASHSFLGKRSASPESPPC